MCANGHTLVRVPSWVVKVQAAVARVLRYAARAASPRDELPFVIPFRRGRVMTIPTKQAQGIASAFIAELDAEMPPTRRLLERVPSDKGDWKPHPKSFSLAHLAQLVARMPGWVDRKSTRLNSSHLGISYAVFCLKK